MFNAVFTKKPVRPVKDDCIIVSVQKVMPCKITHVEASLLNALSEKPGVGVWLFCPDWHYSEGGFFVLVFLSKHVAMSVFRLSFLNMLLQALLTLS